MAHYTILNDTSIKNIFDQYNVGEILEYKVLSGGSENTNYRIKAIEGEYVLTICEKQSLAEATNLARLLVHLNEKGFETSQIIQTQKGEWTSGFGDKPLLLKSYIKGTIAPDFSNQQMEILGKDLAILHGIEAPDFVPRQLGYGIEHFAEVQAHAPDAPFCQWLIQTTEYIQSFLKDDLPKALIHSDIFYNNIITEPQTGQVTIMDFEEATYYYRVYDIGMTLVGTCAFGRQINLEKAQHFLHAYQSENPLIRQEKNALQAFTAYAATATAFWRYMNYNFVRPDETKKSRYKEMQDIAIHVMEIPAEKFSELTI